MYTGIAVCAVALVLPVQSGDKRLLLEAVGLALTGLTLSWSTAAGPKQEADGVPRRRDPRDKAVETMDTPNGGRTEASPDENQGNPEENPEENAEELDRFLSRCRDVSVASVPLYLALAAYTAKEDGWHAGFLVCAVLPLLAAYLGVRAKREARSGMAFAGMVTGGTSLALVIGMAALNVA